MFTFEDYLRRVYDGADIIRFLDKIAETYDVLIFSGVIRDYFMGVDCCPRDLDVVVMMEGNEDMGKFLMPSLCHRNLLGGGIRYALTMWLLTFGHCLKLGVFVKKG